MPLPQGKVVGGTERYFAPTGSDHPFDALTLVAPGTPVVRVENDNRLLGQIQLARPGGRRGSNARIDGCRFQIAMSEQNSNVARKEPSPSRRSYDFSKELRIASRSEASTHRVAVRFNGDCRKRGAGRSYRREFADSPSRGPRLRSSHWILPCRLVFTQPLRSLRIS